MKRLAMLCLVVCLLALSLPAYAASDTVMSVANCESWVSLRESPSTRARRLEKLPKGALVSYKSGTWNGFSFVRYGKRQGYVLTRYLEPQKSLAMVVGNCNSYVTLRERASTSSRTVERIPKGTTVLRVDDVGNGFFRVCHNGKYGYVLSKYLLRAEAKHGTTKAVMNCESYISLRKSPSTKSERLAKIPLDAHVTSFGSNGFGMEYVCYDGKYGFALSEYLVREF